MLFTLFIVPLIASIIAFISSSLPRRATRYFAIAASLIPLIMLVAYGPGQWLNQTIQIPWLSPLAIDFHLKVDSLSLAFLYLTAIIIPISLLAARKEELYSPNIFYAFVLLLQCLLIGFFTAQNLILFVVFWESMLFPLYFIMILWGKSKRREAALQFLVYMIAGSALMVAGVLALYLAAGTFDIDTLAKMGVAKQLPYAPWIFAIFALAFSVKTPLFPFHGWLPSTYYEASTAGTILLSALLSKAGIFGFFRIGINIFPDMMRASSPILLGLAIAGVLYGGMAAWMQRDYKRLIAFSSFSHVNFILAGIFVWNQSAHEGAILQAFNHGITIAGIFLVAGWLEERIGTTSISPYSGLAKYLPQLCWLTMIFVLSSVALPGTNSFIGELLILFGLFGLHPWLASVLGLTVILSVVYMLRWMQHVFFEEPHLELETQTEDIKLRELAIAFPLVALIFWIGLYPQPMLNQIVPAVEQEQVMANGGENR